MKAKIISEAVYNSRIKDKEKFNNFIAHVQYRLDCVQYYLTHKTNSIRPILMNVGIVNVASNKLDIIVSTEADQDRVNEAFYLISTN